MNPTLIPRRSEAIQAQREQGGRVAAVLPIHYPRALLHAFDVLPVEVWGPPRVDPGVGAAHVQSYICSLVRNALSFLAGDGLDVVDLIVVPHACDSLQGLGSLLLDLVRPRQPVLPFYLPRGGGILASESDLRFLSDEFRALYRRLQEITGLTPPPEQLFECTQLDETADVLLAELHRSRLWLELTSLDFYRLIRTREYLPAERFVKVARATLERTVQVPRSGTPLLLSGIVPEPMDLLEAIDGMGGMVAADDLACCGRRLYPPGQSDDPFVRMAQRILTAPPDPTRGSPLAERRDYLLRLAAESGARGVVFYDVKFCEPELFDLPTLRTELRAAGLPSLVLECDLNDSLSQQVATRLEAFLEMIR